MWTSSFTLVAAGYSLALFALFYWMVEVMNWRKLWPWPWIVFGSNAIVAYMFSELFPSVFGFMPWVTFHSAGSPLLAHEDGKLTTIFGWWNLSFYKLIPNPHWAAFGFCLSYLAVCFIPVLILWKKKIFVKI
jgi:predicted acyltransferase